MRSWIGKLRFRKLIGVKIETGYIDVEICLSHDEWIRERGKNGR